ncbi:MAG: hypothetical protein A4E35_02378 [Methanoregula sp. PtaU1.Bin051]|nr:MAG: hypothetical protein A4E35_02378 [Methanoregula sp. PtaU1.Bin051]
MPSPGEIRPIRIGNELNTCPACGYRRGFHISFVTVTPGSGGTPYRSTREVHRIILICPECGARFDPGWNETVHE